MFYFDNTGLDQKYFNLNKDGLISTVVFKGWKENHASDRMKETYRNWVLFHFHFQQTLLKMYDEPNSCAPIQTWIPRGSRMRSDILNKKNHLKRGLIRN